MNVPDDLGQFVEMLRGRRLVEPGAEIAIARAPGRLDVMGGIADYSGSHVLEFPIAEATFVALQPNDERRLNIITLLDDEPHHSNHRATAT